jgi:hypothetical protein
MVFVYGMEHAHLVKRIAALGGMTRVVRLTCMLLLCAAYLSLPGSWRERVVSHSPYGLTATSGTERTGTLFYEVQHATADSVLPRERDNDPFLAFLHQRSAATPTQPVPFVVREVVPCEPDVRPTSAAPPDLTPLHLRLIAKSRQLLC